MTLSTLVGFEEYTDPQEFHDWINRELLGAPHAKYDVIGPEGKYLTDTYRYGHNTMMNDPGQGLDAWAITYHNNGAVIEWESHLAEGEEPEEDEDEPALRVYTDFDTPNGYRKFDPVTGERMGCTDLHREFICRIIVEYATPRNLTVWWHNEFTGGWFKDIEGLVDFR
jgi:hypothetical protein